MLNWTCTACDAFNSPRHKTCWHCGNGRSNLDIPSVGAIQSPANNRDATALWRRVRGWTHWHHVPRLVGVLGFLTLTLGLLSPWVVRISPDSEPELFLGYTLRYGQATIVISLILLFLILRNGLSKGWYILAFVLAFGPIILAPLPTQTMQVFDMIAAQLGGTETAAAFNFFGYGVSLVNWGAVFIMIAATLHIFFSTRFNLSSDSIAKNRDKSFLAGVRHAE